MELFNSLKSRLETYDKPFTHWAIKRPLTDLAIKEICNAEIANPVSEGINYDGTNPFKSSHKEYGFDEPLKYFTPSIGISEISVVSKEDFNTIYTSSLRANSIYLVDVNTNFTKVINKDRLRLDNRIRDLKYVKSLGSLIQRVFQLVQIKL